MDLGSPDKFAVDNINPHEDDISNVGKLDLNLVVRKEVGERCGHENEALGDKYQVDLNHKHHGSSSLHAVIRADKPESPYYKSSSQVQYGLFNGNERTEDVDFNGERTHSYRGGETGVASGRYTERSSSPVEAANFQPELDMEDSARLSPKLSPEVHSNCQLDDIKEKSHHHEVLTKCPDKFSGDLQHERTKSSYEVMEQEGTVHLMKKEYSGNDTLMEDKYYSGKPLHINGEVEGRNAEVHALGRTSKRSASPVRESSLSPVRSPPSHGKLPYSPQGHRCSLHSPRSSRRQISPSPERTAGDGRRVLSEDHPSLSERRTSPSPSRRSRRESPRRDMSLRKRLSSSPRRRQFSQDFRRQDRSVSRSPTSPERTGGSSRRVLSEDHPSLSARQTSPSPSRRSRRESPRRDESLGKRPSSSPRRRHLSPDRRRTDRSVSRSPIRHRDSSYGSRRDHRDRSRSRSPRARDHYRRSPRKYSPRRRSPPGYYSRRRSPRRKPWSPPRNRNNGVGRPGNNLFVAGFSFVTTERDLERKFSRFGRVRDVRIVRDKRSGDSRGFGFLSLERDEDADAAIRALDQTDWNGRVVLVEKSKSH